MTTFGTRLRQARERRKWSIQDLADASSVPYITIYRLEMAANRETMTGTGAKLALALGVSLDWLAGVYEKEQTDDLSRVPPHA